LARKSFLKKIAIPFAALSTGSLITGFKTVKAQTLSDAVFQTRGPLTHNYGGSDKGFSLLEVPKTVIHNLDVITEKLINILDWFNNLPGSLPKLTADLLTTLYNFIAKIILQTPLFIFNNPYLQNASLTFSIVSITIVTILTVFESFMQMFNKKHTDFKKIIKRYSVVAGISGFLPFAFEHGFTYINQLSNAISNIGMVNGGNANGLIYGERMGFFDTLVIILFDLTALSMLVPVCLQAGRRWWDLLVLSAIGPLALSSWVFDRHKHYFYKWWRAVKSHSLSQLVYSVYILLMGVIIFSTQSIHGGIFALVVKVLLVLAGLHRLSHPPGFITSKMDVDTSKHPLKGMYDTLSNLSPTAIVKNKITKAKQRKLRDKYGVRHVDLNKIEKELRKKHKKRYVADLL
jgi:hypothetical protein